MERAASLPAPRGGWALVLPRVAGWRAVALVVALSAVVRTVVGFARQTPTYLPDEYLYSELGRSIATTGRPLVRGEAVAFPALLQPILTAPAWLLHDVAASYHAIQIANSVAMSLAAVPAYLLARRAGVAGGLAVATAVLAVVLPDLVYTGWILSEPFAYPLGLTGALLAVRALERPSAGGQLAFLAVAALAAFTRAQLLLLPVCFVVAVVLLGLRERALVRAVAQQWVVAGLAGLAAILFLVMGSHFGAYGDVLAIQGRLTLGDRLETQTLALLYGSGWLVLPGAALGLAAAFWRPRTRGELAFASFTAPLVVGLLAQASLWGDTGQMQERYLFYCVPLLGVAFALHAGRGWPWWRGYAALSGGLFVLAATVPLSAYAVGAGKDHAAILFALTRADSAFGLGGGALVFGACAGLLAVAGTVLARSRWATVGVTALVLAVPAGLAAAATSYDLRYNTVIRHDYLPADRSWVDDARLHDVALVYAGGASKEGLEQLFWNRSVNRILLLPDAPHIDGFAAGQLDIARDGTLRARRRPARPAASGRRRHGGRAPPRRAAGGRLPDLRPLAADRHPASRLLRPRVLLGRLARDRRIAPGLAAPHRRTHRVHRAARGRRAGGSAHAEDAGRPPHVHGEAGNGATRGDTRVRARVVARDLVREPVRDRREPPARHPLHAARLDAEPHRLPVRETGGGAQRPRP